MLRRFMARLFKSYQFILLEPEGGRTLRHRRINLAAVLTIVLIISLGSGAIGWYFTSRKSGAPPPRYYELQRENHDLRNQLATHQGELSVAEGQIDALKGELTASQQQAEKLKQKQMIYESILQARRLSGVHLLQASAHMDAAGTGTDAKKLFYSVVLVQGGNYPSRIKGSLRITAIGKNGQKQVLQLGKKSAELPYVMVAQIFLQGSVIWQQDWRPVTLHISRLNAKGEERDQMDIGLDGASS